MHTENQSAPRERPILFSGPMVRAILDGRKTVTRRVMAPQPTWINEAAGSYVSRASGRFYAPRDEWLHWRGERVTPNDPRCPFGQPGDRLWVRETFNRTNPGGADGVFYYRADGQFPAAIGGGGFHGTEAWKPSIHMPRWASRILLEITAVRVERLNDISCEQARAEGYPADREAETGGSDMDAWLWFRSQWDAIAGQGSYNENPWVWVVEFKVVKP